MIELQHNRRLKEVLYEEDRFPLGVELVSTRGTMTQKQSLKARAFAEQLTYSDQVDWVSITDNPVGNSQMATAKTKYANSSASSEKTSRAN